MYCNVLSLNICASFKIPVFVLKSSACKYRESKSHAMTKLDKIFKIQITRPKFFTSNCFESTWSFLGWRLHIEHNKEGPQPIRTLLFEKLLSDWLPKIRQLTDISNRNRVKIFLVKLLRVHVDFSRPASTYRAQQRGSATNQNASF